ncbi:hypothetical protein ACES2L_00785 [Bdellovibrio bacteriovorus]
MSLVRNSRAFVIALSLVLSACGGSFESNDSSSNAPAAAEPEYFGTPTDIADPVTVTIAAKFLYRQLDFTPGSSNNGLSSVVTAGNAVAIPFAEFHVYDSSGTRVQQGETNTAGRAIFEMPKTAGSYTLKVFSRSLNDYAKISVLEDIYSNTPYSISKSFTISSSDIASGTLDLSASPVYAEASESLSSKIEGGAFNIMFNVLIANEYIRRNINKNGVSNDGTPSSDPDEWWVADKVTVYWKAGFNPYTYFGSTAPLSFYSPGEKKLYILGGSSGDVKSADTDHFDDSVILHEYAHFLEDTYGNSASPGGSHTGNFVIDARLAWSEGFANYFQGAVLTGADAFDNSASESRIPATKRYHYYVDTYGYKGGGSAGVGVQFNLAAVGSDVSEPDSTNGDLAGTGTFREVSISRTLYKSTRATTESYALTKAGGGVTFQNIWKVFAGENTSGYSRTNPLPYSLNKTTYFPIPNSGLFNWLLTKNGVAGAEWNSILTEEKQNKTTHDYAYLLSAATCAGTTFNGGAVETGYKMSSSDPVNHSHQQMNNDFYLYYHDGGSGTLSISYTTSGNAPDLDLILYYQSYVYFEDDYWKGGYSSNYIAKSSRTVGGTSEQVSLSGLAAGYYVVNVKINAYGKTSAQMNGTSTYKLYKGSQQLCGTEQP